MSDTQAALQAAHEAYQQRNAFDSPTHNMLDDLHARLALSRAQLTCWKAGECCGCQGADGRCLSRIVELTRHAQMYDAGMSAFARERLSALCEHAPQYLEAVSWLVDSNTEAGAVLAGRLWALRFFEYLEGLDNVDGTCGSGKEEKGAGIKGDVVRREIDDHAKDSGGTWTA